MEERRRHPRRLLDVPVRIESEGTSWQGRLRDICRDAALVESDTPVDPNTELKLDLALPGIQELLPVRGRVIRVASGEVCRHGLAVLFAHVPPSVVLRIDLFVELGTEGLRLGGART